MVGGADLNPTDAEDLYGAVPAQLAMSAVPIRNLVSRLKHFAFPRRLLWHAVQINVEAQTTDVAVPYHADRVPSVGTVTLELSSASRA